MSNGYERELLYVYSAVSPMEGEFDWKITTKMNTSMMSEFLAQVSDAHPDGSIVMVVDGASSHVSKDVLMPANMRSLRLPPYAPELNPQEHIWDELGEKNFPNCVFDDLNSVRRELESGLPKLAADHRTVRGITVWPWIHKLNWIAHWNQKDRGKPSTCSAT